MPKLSSCGAILFTIKGGKVHVILGKESSGWLPFKGGVEEYETLEEAAIREVYEETCGVVKIDKIELGHQFSNKRKKYYIGLVHVDHKVIKNFYKNKKKEKRKEFLEKHDIKMFPITSVMHEPRVHSLTKKSIRFYKKKLHNIQKNLINHLMI